MGWPAHAGTHVDIVKNEWLAGFQVVVAQVREEIGGLVVESAEPQIWEPIVLGSPAREPETGELVEAEKEPGRFLELLPRAIHGAYLFATDVHADDRCPFVHRPLIPIRSTPDIDPLSTA